MTVSQITFEKQVPEAVSPFLDLLSISQTRALCVEDLCSPEPELLCINDAPFIAVKKTGKAYLVLQGNCNSWTCPRCGEKRAKREYGRMVAGSEALAKEHDLYFITLTCRGKELSLEDSQTNYLAWTNRLLTAMRTRARRDEKPWHYVQVTERQKRGHPHSHMMATFFPHDLREGSRTSWKHIDGKLVPQKVPALRSDWLRERCISAGLGDQYDISKVRDPAAASRYVAKYLFKPTMFTDEWPKNWRRVRYSRSFPKLPDDKAAEAFPLIKREDWHKLAKLAVIVTPDDSVSQQRCLEMLHGSDVIIRSLTQKLLEADYGQQQHQQNTTQEVGT